VARYPKEQKDLFEALIDTALEAEDSLRSIGAWKVGWRTSQKYQAN
jgi:hypothetical protein